MARILGPHQVEGAGRRPRPRSPWPGPGSTCSQRRSRGRRRGCGGCRRRTASATGRRGRRRTPSRPPRPRCPTRPAPLPPARRWPAPRRRPRRTRASATRPPCAAAWASSRAANHDASGRGRERRSLGSGPTTTSSAATTSARRRAIGPLVDRCCQSGADGPPLGTRPSDGFIPDRPQHDDGMRIDPPPSEPVAKRHHARRRWPPRSPRTIPPAMWSRFHGLRVGPNTVLSVSAFHPELRRVGFPHHHAPGRHQSRHHGRVRMRRRAVGKGRRSMRGHEAGRVLEVLHRRAGYRPTARGRCRRQPCVDRFGR